MATAQREEEAPGRRTRRSLSISSLCDPQPAPPSQPLPVPSTSSSSSSSSTTPTATDPFPGKMTTANPVIAPVPRQDPTFDEEEAMQIAASALNGMRNSAAFVPRQHGSGSSTSTGSPDIPFKHPGAPASASGGYFAGVTTAAGAPGYGGASQSATPIAGARIWPASATASDPLGGPSILHHPSFSSDPTTSQESVSSVSTSLTPSLASLSTDTPSSEALSPATSATSSVEPLPNLNTLRGAHTATAGPSSTTATSEAGESVYWDAEGKPVDANGEPMEVEMVQVEGPEGGVFLHRVVKMPLVSAVVRGYERGKGTSRVVRYGADLVESGVTSIGGRVASKVGPQRIAQIDRYAGAALDRLGYGATPSGSGAEDEDVAEGEAGETSLVSTSGAESPVLRRRRRTGKKRVSISGPAGADVEMEDDDAVGGDVSTTSGTSPDSPATSRDDSAAREVQVRPSPGRSRWQNMLVEAGMTAGGIGAAVSEESMKSLKYCLQWLQYANAHLDHQIALLRDFIASLNIATPGPNAQQSALIPHHHSQLQTLTSIKRDVIETIRRVVDVVSKYAGGSLPEPAKAFVRKSILSLPVRWAAAIQQESGAGGVPGLSRPGTPSSIGSTPLMSPRMPGGPTPSTSTAQQPGGSGGGYFSTSSMRRGSVSSMSGISDISGSVDAAGPWASGSGSGATTAPTSSASATTPGLGGQPGDRKATQQAAERVLTFAVESLDMLRSVTAIFSESVERADAWVERLRVLGIQHRQRQRAAGGGDRPIIAPSALRTGQGDNLDSASEADEGELGFGQQPSLASAYRVSQAMTPSQSGDSLTSQHLAALGSGMGSSTTATNLAPSGSTTKRRKANGGAPAPVPAAEYSGAPSTSSVASPALSSEYEGDEIVEDEGLRRKRAVRN